MVRIFSVLKNYTCREIFAKMLNRIVKGTLSWDEIQHRDKIFLYAGTIPSNKINGVHYKRKDYVGLSLDISDYRHIKHDITKPYPIGDNTIDAYQAEDVLEHIEYDKLVDVFNEIYRVLKVGGYFRLSVPDYRCDILYERSDKDERGNVIFDPQGGGKYVNGKVVDGGHVWFPTYEKVEEIIKKSNFNIYTFYHYTLENGESYIKPIDYSKGFIQRTPDNDDRVKKPYRAMSIVVDLYK